MSEYRFTSNSAERFGVARPLSQQEGDLISRLLEQDVLGSKELRDQLKVCLVFPINKGGTILRFEIFPDTTPATVPYKQNVAVEASTSDDDGSKVEVLLHVKDGFLFELEYVKYSQTPLIQSPSSDNLHSFEVYVSSEAEISAARSTYEL